jgi:predicted HTH domain antitoxin
MARRGLMALTIELPKHEQEALEPYRDRLNELLLLGLSQVRIQEALLMYQRGAASMGRAAELAGLPEEDFIRHAHASGVEPAWTEEMIAEDLA